MVLVPARDVRNKAGIISEISLLYLFISENRYLQVINRVDHKIIYRYHSNFFTQSL